MARPRAYDVDDVLDRAMHVFWSKGYEAASLNDLVAATGLSKSSFYEAFHSKHRLFLRTIERYNATVIERMAAILERDAPGRAVIAALFDDILDTAVADGERRGCYLCNCAVERAARDREAARCVNAGLERLEEAFHGAVVRAQAEGNVAAGRDARVLAVYLASSAQGLRVMTKARHGREGLDEVVATVLSALD